MRRALFKGVRCCLILCIGLSTPALVRGENAPTSATHPVRIEIEAEDASTMDPVFSLRRDEDASGGEAVGVPEGRGKPPKVTGRITYTFTVPVTGKYRLWIRKWWLDGCGNSVRIGVDDLPVYTVGEDGTYRRWDWAKLPVPLPLSKGEHTLYLYNNEDGAWVDKILITNRLDYVPTGKGKEQGGGKKRSEIYLTDDFMRTENTGTRWEEISGKWSITSLDHPRLSANAFRYTASPSGGTDCMSLVGYPSWKNYSIEVSAMLPEKGEMGLVLLARDKEHFYLWRLPVGYTRKETTLVYVDGNTRKTLFSRRLSLVPGAWYRLKAMACDGNLLLEVDGIPIGTAKDTSSLAGRCGLFAAGGEAFFDDVFVSSCFLSWERFAGKDISAWKAAGDLRLVNRNEGTPLSRRNRLLNEAIEKVREGGLLSTGRGFMLSRWKPGERIEGFFDVSFLGKGSSLAILLGKASIPVSAERLKDGRRHRVYFENDAGMVRVLVDGRVVTDTVLAGTEGPVGLAFGEKGILIENLVLKATRFREPRRRITEQFTKEHSMSNWASRGADWKRKENKKKDGTRSVRYFSKLRFPGRIRMGYPLKGIIETGDTLRMGIGIPPAGCSLEAAPAGNDLRITLRAGDAQANKTIKGHPDAVIRLCRSGDTVGIAMDDKLTLVLAAPGKGDIPWVETEGKKEPDLSLLEMEAPDTRDYTMSRAPADWTVTNGEYRITNRWKCDPRWSWFALMSPAEAIMWHKMRFDGDVTVDMWAGIKMERRRGGPPYGDPGDINLTICANGKGLGTGYSFLFGGFDNTTTCLLKRDTIVKKTTEEHFLLPSPRHHFPSNFHRRWFHLTLEKRGNTVRCLLDGKKVLEYADEQPLRGDRIAAWTFDNGIMIARLRISARRLLPPTQPVSFERSSPLHTPAAGIPALSSRQFRFRMYDFETGRQGWNARPVCDHFSFDWASDCWTPRESNDREVDVYTVKRQGGGRCLHVKNLSGGGTFAVSGFLKGVSLLEFPWIRFDYRIPPVTRMNLYVKVEGRFHTVVLTGPEGDVINAPVIGKVNLTTDGKWHTAEFNLRNMFLQAGLSSNNLEVEDAFFGTMNNDHYLVCGIGGNPRGAWYELDNVVLFGTTRSPRPEVLERMLKEGYRLKLTRKGKTEAAVSSPSDIAKVKVPFEEGRWTLHLSRADGGTVEVPFLVDRTPPRLKGMQQWHGGKIKILFDDPSGVDFRKVKTFIGRKQVKPSFDIGKSELRIDPNEAGIRIPNGRSVTLKIENVVDLAGNACKAPFELRWKVDYRLDKTAPVVVRVKPPLYSEADNDFEEGLHGWYATSEEHTRLSLASDAAEGKKALLVRNYRVGNPMRIRVRTAGVDLRRFQELKFFYRLKRDVDVDIGIRTVLGGYRHYIAFADEGRYDRKRRKRPFYIGTVPEVKQDGKWHEAEVNLYKMLLLSDRSLWKKGKRAWSIEEIEFSDYAWCANPFGGEYAIDGWRFIPYMNGKEAAGRWEIEWWDVSGIRRGMYRINGGRWNNMVLDDDSQWNPDTLPEGRLRVEVKLQDGAGNWSEPYKCEVVVDKTPPRIVKADPPPGTRAATRRLILKVRDPSGLSLTKTRITIGKTGFPLWAPSVYDPRSNTIRVTLPEKVMPADGQKVNIGVRLADNVGNVEEKTLGWIMDYSLDKTPPRIYYLCTLPASPRSEAAFFEDFEDGETKLTFSGAPLGIGEYVAASGRRCAVIHNAGGGGVIPVDVQLKMAESPFLAFDYRCNGKITCRVRFRVNKKWDVRMLPGKKPEAARRGRRNLIVREPGIRLKGDGKWHRLLVVFNSIPLQELLQKGTSKKEWKDATISALAIELRAKGDLYIDNLAVMTPPTDEKTDVLVGCNYPLEETGIKAFHWEIPGGRTIETQEPLLHIEKRLSGIVRLFAEDSAGNRSEAMTIDLGKDPLLRLLEKGKSR